MHSKTVAAFIQGACGMIPRIPSMLLHGIDAAPGEVDFGDVPPAPWQREWSIQSRSPAKGDSV